jgi:hypothetical protein
VLSAREGLDDEHRRAAVSAHEGGPGAAVIGAAIAEVSERRWRRLDNMLMNVDAMRSAYGECLLIDYGCCIPAGTIMTPHRSALERVSGNL